VPVEAPHEPERVDEVRSLAGRAIVLPVVLVGVLLERGEKLRHGDLESPRRRLDVPAAGEPLRDDAVVLGAALRSAERSEVVVAPRDAHARLPARLVVAVRRNSVLHRSLVSLVPG